MTPAQDALYTAGDYRMSGDLQITTLAIAIIVVAVMVAGIAAIARDVRANWSIEDANADIDDMARDYYIGRDLHTDIRDSMRRRRNQRTAPRRAEMPRWKGWRI